MAKYMDYDPRKFSAGNISGKTVLELGSGCGLGGLAFMVRGAAVTFTDLSIVIENITAENVKVIPFLVICFAIF